MIDDVDLPQRSKQSDELSEQLTYVFSSALLLPLWNGEIGFNFARWSWLYERYRRVFRSGIASHNKNGLLGCDRTSINLRTRVRFGIVKIGSHILNIGRQHISPPISKSCFIPAPRCVVSSVLFVLEAIPLLYRRFLCSLCFIKSSFVPFVW